MPKTKIFEEKLILQTKIRSVLGISGLAFVFVAVFFVNDKSGSSLDSAPESSNLRQIASTSSMSPVLPDSLWQKSLATKLSELDHIPSGRSAHRPSHFEAFIFGELKGYYLMELENEKIKEMHLNLGENPDAPHYQGSELSFLKKNQDFWWVSFNSLSIKKNDPQKTVVSLLNSNQKSIGEALFEFDKEGRLISLKIEKQ